jgi:hypothetical protein
MTKRSILPLATGSLLALAIAAPGAAAAPGHSARVQDGVDRRVENGSPFERGAVCDVNRAGPFSFLDSSKPFRGGLAGSAYGDIFFGGGAIGSAVSPSSAATDGSSPVTDTSPGGSAWGTAPSNGITVSPSIGSVKGPDTTTGEAGGGTGADSGSGNPVGVIPPVVEATPEPGSLILLGLGVVALIAARRHVAS